MFMGCTATLFAMALAKWRLKPFLYSLALVYRGFVGFLRMFYCRCLQRCVYRCCRCCRWKCCKCKVHQQQSDDGNKKKSFIHHLRVKAKIVIGFYQVRS